MSDESVLAPEAGPEVVTPEAEAPQVETETAPVEAESADVSASKLRREREKAAKQRTADELTATKAALAEAEAKRGRIEAAARQTSEPNEAEWPDPIEYSVARATWKMNQRGQQQEATAAGQEVEAAKAKQMQAVGQYWAVQQSEARQRYSDFDAVALTAPISNDVAMLLAASEGGADLAYALGQDHALARHVSTMNPVQAAMALGEMKARLYAPQARKATQAPDPVNPVRGSASATIATEKMDGRDYIARRASGWTPT